MRDFKFYYKIEVALTFTNEELAVLKTLSESHYDAHCRSISAVGGFLYGMLNHQKFGLECDPKTQPVHELEFRELDTFAKILEMRTTLSYPEAPAEAQRQFGVASLLYFEMHELCRAINKEFRRMNPESP